MNDENTKRIKRTRETIEIRKLFFKVHIKFFSMSKSKSNKKLKDSKDNNSSITS